MTPFAVFKQDADEMIMLINCLLDMGADAHNAKQKTAPARDDGFWDF